MNVLKISKQGFYDDVKPLLNSYAPILGHYMVNREFYNTFRSVVEIIQNKPERVYYELFYPEKHFPNNASQQFWGIVCELIDRGVMFNVVTSDVTAVGWVPKKRMIDGIVTQGWDDITVEYIDPVTRELSYYEPLHGYGHEINYLKETIKF
jgi:hypothetical protein